jgi:hypothetical protein
MFPALEDSGKTRLTVVVNYSVRTACLRKFEVSAWVVRKGARNQHQKRERNRCQSHRCTSGHFFGVLTRGPKA